MSPARRAVRVFVSSTFRDMFAEREELITGELFAHAEEPFVLLGRDILNLHRIVLDGPNLSLEIS